ncbi:alpha/beta fold hydrolase [Marinicella sp. W31]|uniref:alpha/beta fold hydrolase n=1 Tax=Marinicella sp. W31 TaxID=3023713 RepID=UPI0037573858
MKSKPEIKFAKTNDDVKIAYTISGQGPILVKAANWFTHIELDWKSSVWSHWFRDLSKHTSLVRYDERGCGLSDRKVSDLSFDSWVDDLETVVDAIGLKRFPLLGISQGGAVAIAYAIRNPNKVSHLILYGAYGRGRLIRDSSKLAKQEAATMNQLIQLGWGKEHDAFRQVFSSQFMPNGTLEQFQAFNELQKASCSPENAVRFLNEFNQINVMSMASQIKCPTLIMHSRGDLRVPFEEGRLLATQIPDAQFIPLESSNHILLSESMWDVFLNEINVFLQEQPLEFTKKKPLKKLTPREYEVLDYIARGHSNNSISKQLALHEKTVRNNITRIFSKLEVKTRAEAIVLAREAGMGKGSHFN